MLRHVRHQRWLLRLLATCYLYPRCLSPLLEANNPCFLHYIVSRFMIYYGAISFSFPRPWYSTVQLNPTSGESETRKTAVAGGPTSPAQFTFAAAAGWRRWTVRQTLYGGVSNVSNACVWGEVASAIQCVIYEHCILPSPSACLAQYLQCPQCQQHKHTVQRSAAPRFQSLLSHRLDRSRSGAVAGSVLSRYLPLGRVYPQNRRYRVPLLPSLSRPPPFCAHLLARSNLEPIFSLQTLPPFASSTISSLSSPDANLRSFIIRHASPRLRRSAQPPPKTLSRRPQLQKP